MHRAAAGGAGELAQNQYSAFVASRRQKLFATKFMPS
jgi:hypothetical protein